MVRSLAVALSIVCASAVAHADAARAWAVAREHAPASAVKVLALDLDTISASSLGAFLTPALGAYGARETLDTIQKKCGIDAVKAVDGVVLVSSAKDRTGVFVVSLDPAVIKDASAVEACATAFAAARTAEAPAPAVQAAGAVRTLAVGDQTIYARWLAPDVLAIPAKAGDKAMLTAFTSGRGAFAKAAVAKLVAKTNTSAALWYATAVSQSVDGKTMKAGYGSLDVADKLLRLSVAMTFGSAREAKAVEKLASDQIVALLASGRLDAVVMEMLNQVNITSTGAALSVSGAIPEDQLMPLIGALSPR